jgi:hypothetical protein
MRNTSSPSDKNNAQPDSQEKVDTMDFSRAGARPSLSKEIEAVILSHNNGNSHLIVFGYGFEFEKLFVLWLSIQFVRSLQV